MQQISRFIGMVAAVSLGVLLTGNAPNTHSPALKKHSLKLPRGANSDRSEILRGVAAWKAAGASDVPANMSSGKPTNYKQYPIQVRSLIRLTDLEDGRCRGRLGGAPETLRACNRRDHLLVLLEKKGWCWGGSHVGYLEHWLRCADDPDYRRDHGRRRNVHL